MFNDIHSGFEVFSLAFHFLKKKAKSEIQCMFFVSDFHRKIEKQNLAQHM